MKIMRQGGDYLIIDDKEKVIEIVKEKDIIDGDAVMLEQKRRKAYTEYASTLSNESLLEAFAELVGTIVLEKDSNYPDFDSVAEVIYEAIIARMSK